MPSVMRDRSSNRNPGIGSGLALSTFEGGSVNDHPGQEQGVDLVLVRGQNRSAV